jgi:hypothetical protein
VYNSRQQKKNDEEARSKSTENEWKLGVNECKDQRKPLLMKRRLRQKKFSVTNRSKGGNGRDRC